jgi:hypothetical protein
MVAPMMGPSAPVLGQLAQLRALQKNRSFIIVNATKQLEATRQYSLGDAERVQPQLGDVPDTFLVADLFS